LLLQLQKSYKGDERFKLLENDFNVDLKEAAKHRKQLPSAMLGALSKREEELLREDEAPKVMRVPMTSVLEAKEESYRERH